MFPRAQLMNYFLAAHFALLLGSIFLTRVLVIRSSTDRPILAPVLAFGRRKREEFRFFPDFFYTLGIIYSFLCGLLLLSNCIEIWRTWGLFYVPTPLMIGLFLLEKQPFYYILIAIGFVIAFFILPNRTLNLQDAQAAFVFFSLTWLSIASLGIFLCK